MQYEAVHNIQETMQHCKSYQNFMETGIGGGIMAEKFHFDLADKERLPVSFQVDALTVRKVEGKHTVLRNHAPFMRILHPVVIVPGNEGEAGQFSVSTEIAGTGPDSVDIPVKEAFQMEKLKSWDIKQQIQNSKRNIEDVNNDSDQDIAESLPTHMQDNQNVLGLNLLTAGAKYFFYAIFAMQLVSCGSSSNSAPPQVDSQPRYSKQFEYFPNQSSLIDRDTTTAGHGIFSIPVREESVEGGSVNQSQQNWHIWSEDVGTAKRIMSGNFAIYDSTSTADSDNSLQISGGRWGLNSAREEVYVKFESEKMNSDAKNEFVEISLLNIGSRAIASSGSQFSGSLPTGTHKYAGKAYVFEPLNIVSRPSRDLNGVTYIPNEHSAEVYLCDFTMFADFERGSAEVDATSQSISNNVPTYQFYGDNIEIVRSTGEIRSSNVQYEIARYPTVNSSGSAKLIGSFAGNQAIGIHGMVYSNSDENEQTEFAGVFFGTRKPIQ